MPVPTQRTQDWNEEQKAKLDEKLKGWNPDDEDGEPEEDKAEDDGIPFACFTCRRTWAECRSAVITRCKHYFCEPCALK